jgi:phosphotransferase system HPr (HPr) family protein
MASRLVKIGNGVDGLDNPVAELIHAACKFNSTVYFQDEQRKINAKSIMGMMNMPMHSGMEVSIVTEGEDEDFALTELERFLTC